MALLEITPSLPGASAPESTGLAAWEAGASGQREDKAGLSRLLRCLHAPPTPPPRAPCRAQLSPRLGHRPGLSSHVGQLAVTPRPRRGFRLGLGGACGALPVTQWPVTSCGGLMSLSTRHRWKQRRYTQVRRVSTCCFPDTAGDVAFSLDTPHSDCGQRRQSLSCESAQAALAASPRQAV